MLALEGIKIIDLTWQGPGPFCNFMLSDLGADVISVSAPAAAGARQELKSATPWDAPYESLYRNRKSIQINLKSAEGKEIISQLCRQADVFMEGFRPGVVQRLGIDYEAISKINPRIVYCSITGYGQDGPYRDFPGHDINYISFGGALEAIGVPGQPPVIPLNLVADYAAGGQNAAIGILTALIAREKTGRGQHVDISLTDGVVSLLTFFLGDYFRKGEKPERGAHYLSGGVPNYNVYQTKDGKYITIACLEAWLWANLCREIGREDFVPYGYLRLFYSPDEADKAKKAEIESYLREVFLTKTSDEWFESLIAKDIPVAKVHSLDEVFRDPHILHRQMLIEMEHPTEGKIKQVGIAIKLSDTPGKARRMAPLPGEHTEEILTELGYSAQKIDELRQSGVV